MKQTQHFQAHGHQQATQAKKERKMGGGGTEKQGSGMGGTSIWQNEGTGRKTVVPSGGRCDDNFVNGHRPQSHTQTHSCGPHRAHSRKRLESRVTIVSGCKDACTKHSSRGNHARRERARIRRERQKGGTTNRWNRKTEPHPFLSQDDQHHTWSFITHRGVQNRARYEVEQFECA